MEYSIAGCIHGVFQRGRNKLYCYTLIYCDLDDFCGIKSKEEKNKRKNKGEVRQRGRRETKEYSVYKCFKTE